MPNRKNIYQHEIDLRPLKIKNGPRKAFAKLLEDIPYRGYEVEITHDGRSIVITKPGGKSVYGRLKKEDFLVSIYNKNDKTLWQITHNQILEDLKQKSRASTIGALRVIELLEKVHAGHDPDDILHDSDLNNNLPGEPVDVLLKVYKWIWGQEDVNYPDGQGRDMSIKSIIELKNEIVSSGLDDDGT